MKRIVYIILKGIADDQKLSTYPQGDTPLSGLITSYNKLRERDASLRLITVEHTGSELKDAIACAPAEDQIRLLYNYNNAISPAIDSLAEIQQLENHRLKHWLIKAGFAMAASMAWVVTGAMVVIAYKSGSLSEGVVVNGIMGTATEILKLIFGIAG